MGRSPPRASTKPRPAGASRKWSKPAPKQNASELQNSGAALRRSPKKIMPHSIVMPALEMAQETGKLLAWRKKEGEFVSQGEPLLDIETDKAVVEIESPASGILTAVKARVGDVVPVGQAIAWIVLPGENPLAE